MGEDNSRSIELDVDDLERFKLRYSLGQDDGRGSKHFLRIKVTEGAVSSRQLTEIARLSDEYGRGKAWITDRQSIQLHWIEGRHAPEIFSRLEEIGFTTDKCGQAYPAPGYGDVRNICACPVAGYEKGEKIDVRPLVKEMNDFFIGNEDFLDMPKKFKISISACEIDCVRSQMQDLGLFTIERERRPGFGAVIGGSLGVAQPGAVIGKPLNVFIEPDEVFEVAKNMAEIHRDHSSTESVAKARFKQLVREWGVEKIRSKLEEKLGRKLERLKYSGPEVSGREHVGVQEQKDGNFYINIPVLGGGLSSEQLRRAAEIAEEYGSGDLRTTPYQNLILLNVAEESLDGALTELKKTGLSVEGSRLRWESVGCASDFCASSPEYHPKAVAREIIEHLEKNVGKELEDYRMKIGVSGCPRDCGLKGPSDIGLLGASTGNDGVGSEEYRLYIGGRFGADPRFSKALDGERSVDDIKIMLRTLVEKSLEEEHDDFQELWKELSSQELKEIAELEVEGKWEEKKST
ncbi:hypothetical protein AKJ63_00225 [candidate division MSBL1 archaeon SCGC-AAA259D18]|uniref:Ferredoxin--nitrite reductase n=1 Tax=candidate division MSBL1 archaeon SCGC-AAA259D18 TaxID=1698262 RepID=A0A133UCP4_9EURY|nr:hypothetical protein AKJ63_00225 [candidate division MSBL1 archaeon SCGC-AAA259D18]